MIKFLWPDLLWLLLLLPLLVALYLWLLARRRKTTLQMCIRDRSSPPRRPAAPVA